MNENHFLKPVYELLGRFQSISPEVQEDLVTELRKVTEAEVAYNKAQVARIRVNYDNLKIKQDRLLDGTLSKYDKAAHNIKRSLDKSREIRIFYVYQKPEVAWKFTVARETAEGRNIPKNAFIERFLDSRQTIDRIRKDFDERVVIFLVKKNFETHVVEDIIEIKPDGPTIEHYLGVGYTRDDLEKLL